jgi:hypothetical protein
MWLDKYRFDKLILDIPTEDLPEYMGEIIKEEVKNGDAK